MSGLKENVDSIVRELLKRVEEIKCNGLNVYKLKEEMEPFFIKEGYRDIQFNGAKFKGYGRILIIYDAAPQLGDFVVLSPCLREIRRLYPYAHITLCTYIKTVERAKLCPYINAMVGFDIRNRSDNILNCYMSAVEIAKELLKYNFDICFSFESGSIPMSGLIAYMSGAKYRIGTPRNFGAKFAPLLTSYTLNGNYQHGFHIIDDLLSCIDKMLGVPVQNRRPEMWLKKEDYVFAEGVFNKQSKCDYCALCIGASDAKRRYPISRYIKLIEYISKFTETKFVILGGKDVETQSKSIDENVALKSVVINLVGKTSFTETAAIIGKCDFVISNDTSTNHVAAAMNVPVLTPVAVAADIDRKFGVVIQRWYPYGVPCVIVMPEYAKPSCKKKNEYQGCISHNPCCITSISPEDMFEGYKVLKKKIENKDIEPCFFVKKDDKGEVIESKNILESKKYLNAKSSDAFRKNYLKDYEYETVLLHKKLLIHYVRCLEQVCYIRRIEPSFSEKFDNVKWFLSDDKQLHYEIFFRKDFVCVGLHFEGKWISKKDVVNFDVGNSDFVINKDWLGYFYKCENFDGMHVSAMMNYLISVTYPVLLNKGIIKDVLF